MRILIYSLLLLMTLVSCWPSSISFKDIGSMPEEWKTFSINTLENNAPNAPISYPSLLADDIRDGIQNNTRLKLSTTVNSGEIRIDGVISSYIISPIAMQPGDNSAKNRLTITSNYKILILAPKEQEMQVSCSRFADYNSDQDLTNVENELLKEINKQIVQDIINKLLSNW